MGEFGVGPSMNRFEQPRHARLSPAARECARRFGRRRDWRSVLALCGDWGLVVAAAWVSLRVPGPVVYGCSVLVIARQMNAIAELHHHAIHCNLFRVRRLNTALDFLYSLPLFMQAKADRDSHLDHHATYSVANGTYLWGRGYGLDLDRRGDRRYMIWFLLMRPFLGPLQWAALKNLVADPNWRDGSFRRAMLIFWTIVAAGFTALGRLDILLWYWLVPFFSFFQVFFFLDDMMGHYNCPRTGTRDMRGLSFLLITGHGTTHHNLHHLYPAIPWFNMRRASRRLVDESDIDVARGFCDGLRQMLAPDPKCLTRPG